MTDRSALTKKILVGMLAGLLQGLWFTLYPWMTLITYNTIWRKRYYRFGRSNLYRYLKITCGAACFVSLACGASNLSGGTSLGRIGIKTLGLYLFTTAAAITLALIVANIINPGLGMSLASDTVFVGKESPPIKQVFLDIFPVTLLKQCRKETCYRS